ncbi:MAG TPA: hypothetical protein VFM65_05710 [Flavobacteriaceae bacterium]|nr:hypothetical protein [Flavobacteriaceae bacterium]
MMKKVLPLFMLLISFCGYSQQKEWQKIVSLLKEEGRYFEGKKGFIKLGESEHNTFTVSKFEVNDSLINIGMKFQDRFENEGSEQFLEETTMLYPEIKINSAAIAYGYRFYFEDFPEAQFLKLVFEEEFPMTHQIISIYKDLKTGQEDLSVMEETTYKIYFPIRNKNRKKILKAIDEYQLQTLKKKLENDQYH